MGWYDWFDARCKLSHHLGAASFDAYIVVYDSRRLETYNDIEQVAGMLTSLDKPVLLVSTREHEATELQVTHSMVFYLAKDYGWESWTVVWSDEMLNDFAFQKITYICSRRRMSEGWNHLKTDRVLGSSDDTGGLRATGHAAGTSKTPRKEF